MRGQPKMGHRWKAPGERTGAKAPPERGSAGMSRAGDVRRSAGRPWALLPRRGNARGGGGSCPVCAGTCPSPWRLAWPGGFPDAATPRAGQATGSLGGDAPGVLTPPRCPVSPPFCPRFAPVSPPARCRRQPGSWRTRPTAAGWQRALPAAAVTQRQGETRPAAGSGGVPGVLCTPRPLLPSCSSSPSSLSGRAAPSAARPGRR